MDHAESSEGVDEELAGVVKRLEVHVRGDRSATLAHGATTVSRAGTSRPSTSPSKMCR